MPVNLFLRYTCVLCVYMYMYVKSVENDEKCYIYCVLCAKGDFCYPEHSAYPNRLSWLATPEGSDNHYSTVLSFNLILYPSLCGLKDCW